MSAFDKWQPLVYYMPRWTAGCGPAPQAEVAELADALRSGRSEGDLVGVQISPSAPLKISQLPELTFIPLGNSLTVERLILDQVVGVRVPVPQPETPSPRSNTDRGLGVSIIEQ